MALKVEDLSVGDVVTYSDMANPERTFMVVAVPLYDFGAQFKLVQVSGEDWEPEAWLSHKYSDCRQAGWNRVEI
jgi:hypothetical protein